MEYCSLDDAFPASNIAAANCRDTSATKEQARNERRRAKKCRGPQADYLADPDRPSLLSAPDEPDMMRGSGAVNPYNRETGLFENGPLGSDPMIGSSGGPSVQMPNGQSVDDLLVRAPRSAYVERRAPKTPATNTMLVETEGPAKLTPSKVPAYFGADLNDDGAEGFINMRRGNAEEFMDLKASGGAAKKATGEGFANFSPSLGNKEEYMMSTDFAKTFGMLGRDRASGAALPVPSVVDTWKKMTPSGAQSAFIDALPLPGGTYGAAPQPQPDLSKQLDRIFARLDDLENGRGGVGENTQMEIFMFILSGVFVMFAVDAFARKR